MSDILVPDLMDLRKRVIDGEDPVSPEEYALVIDNLRSDRTAKPVKKATKSKTTAAQTALEKFPPDLADLFNK